MSLLDVIRDARRSERSVALCLRGDLVGEFETLERDLTEASTRGADSFAGDGKAREIAERMEDLREQMKAATVTFRLRAMGNSAAAALLAEHTPREGNTRDRNLGYNPETFYPAIIRACCYRLDRDDDTLDAAEMTDEDWTTLFASLSSKQFDELFGAAWLTDHGEVAVPTSPLASLISQRNGESSKQHGAGESVPAGSKGGSRRKPRSTSTTTPAA